VQIRVYYEDTDAGGVVYHTNYIQFCERARSEIFFSNNIVMDEENGYFVVKNLQANFIKSAKLGDMLDVTTEVKELKKASVTLHQCVYKDEVKLFEMDVNIVYLVGDKIRKIPEEKLVFFS
jgi:acyl-CoA thioester hydrolase